MSEEQASAILDAKLFWIASNNNWKSVGRQSDQWKQMELRIYENLVWNKGLISNYLCAILPPCSANWSLRGKHSLSLWRPAPGRAI